MRVLSELQFKFSQPQWYLDPELAIFDTVLHLHPELLELVKDEVLAVGKQNGLGRQDSPTVEQVVRAAIYKEIKGLSYAELEYHQYDSKICDVFLQLEKYFSDSVWQKYISVIRAESLDHVLKAVNRLAIDMGLEDLQKLRMDTTVVETDIHYPTNNALMWDCIRTSTRILQQLTDRCVADLVRDYTGQAKTYYFRINVTQDKATRRELFERQFRLFDRSLRQTKRVLERLSPWYEHLTPADQQRMDELAAFVPKMETVRNVAYRREIQGEQVPPEDKLFSIYEDHTEMIVKGKEHVRFGRKTSLASGRSGLILHAAVLEGTSDGATFEPTLQDVITSYHTIPRDVATDGAYASRDHQQIAQQLGVKNIVFNKVVGSLQNITSSLQMETRLKKWRSGIEAVISNVKRGFNLRRCSWKGEAHFKAKVFWSVIAYNLRVMSRRLLRKLAQQLAS
jgi:IS5 family transposase